MSIATEIERLKIAKADIKQSIINKGVAVSDDDSISTYASKIDSIKSGGDSIIPVVSNIKNKTSSKQGMFTTPIAEVPTLFNITNSIYEEV